MFKELKDDALGKSISDHIMAITSVLVLEKHSIIAMCIL